MLRRVAAILQDHLEEIVRGWVADLRQTDHTEVHNEMFSAQIVDGMKAMISNVAATIEQGIAPDAETAQAAGAAELFSGRTPTDEAPAAPVAEQPPPLTLPPQVPAPERTTSGRQPSPRQRRFYRAQLPRGSRRPVADLTLEAESLRRALEVAEHSGRLRQQQGYEINEVVQEYLHLRRRFWQTLGHKLRRNDRAAVELAIYIDGLLDNLLIATVQSYQDATLRELQRRAVRDSLTELFNHSYCWERIHEEARRYRRYGTPFTVLLFDLDHLKRINDTYGHQMGDRVLSHVAAAMHLVARSTDILCRYAGDEFVLILPGTEKHEAATLAERLRLCVQQPVIMGAGLRVIPAAEALTATATLIPTISLGLASCPADARVAETLIAQADRSLYRAKAAGRNTIE
ncbi:MAG: GGDEF domain-containing protein [Chloroflexota bacterium]|nr:GGDEF domain-containing protein [Chloroflexota bacterium]